MQAFFLRRVLSFLTWLCMKSLKYTKDSGEEPPSSEPGFSQDSLSPNYAVLPKKYLTARDWLHILNAGGLSFWGEYQRARKTKTGEYRHLRGTMKWIFRSSANSKFSPKNLVFSMVCGTGHSKFTTNLRLFYSGHAVFYSVKILIKMNIGAMTGCVKLWAFI